MTLEAHMRGGWREMDRADCNNGKRGLWLKILDRLNLGFAC